MYELVQDENIRPRTDLFGNIYNLTPKNMCNCTAIIEEMIEESKTQWEWFGYDSWTLEEVLSRIRAENIS